MKLVRATFFLAGIFFGLMQTAVKAAETPNRYRENMKSGLAAETNRDYPAAIAAYVQAYQERPTEKLPKQRLEAIFQSLINQKLSTEPYEILLPKALADDFIQRGLLTPKMDAQMAESKLSRIIWMVVGGVLLLGAMVIGFILYRIRESENDSGSTVQSRRKSGSKSPKPGSSPFPKKETIVTEKTRENMTGLIGSVKSIQTSSDTGDTSKDEINSKGLEESGLIQTMAQDMVSQVTSDGESHQKFSKMSLDASLIFDDEESA